jgi:hypothetical protein
MSDTTNTVTDETTTAILRALARLGAEDREITEGTGLAILAKLREVEALIDNDPLAKR